ncbi:hypothetical protein N7523_000735 [Penicillium sp. IBT 18751x]|nr:hypothetical protein N7523_000735 [Penicillium sp. IBT 18751x]
MAASFSVPPLEADFPFDIISHLVPVSPFREYPRAIFDDRKGVYLSVKQYIPRNEPFRYEDTIPITILASGGVGFIKELYEPLFAEILHRARQNGTTINSIWIADMYNIGESAVANRHNLGCEPSWYDHSRDLMDVINHFRDKMARPIIGLGHSFGCNQLFCMSIWHPTLFHSLAFIEPGIDPLYGMGTTIGWANAILKFKNVYPTRKEAEAQLFRLHNAKNWERSVSERFREYGVYKRKGEDGEKWAITTPKDQLVALIGRINAKGVGRGPGGIADVTLADRESVPDADPEGQQWGVFYRPELKKAWDMLPNMRPWALYVGGNNSPAFGSVKIREERLRLTGIGVGGNGGVRLGAVKQVVIEDGEHTMTFDHNLYKVAGYVADFLATESKRWVEGPLKRHNEWLQKSLTERQSIGRDYIDALTEEKKRTRPDQRLAKL